MLSIGWRARFIGQQNLQVKSVTFTQIKEQNIWMENFFCWKFQRIWFTTGRSLTGKCHSNALLYLILLDICIIHRHDSTIPIPYYKWAYYNPAIKQMPQTENYAANKTKKVAWLVSNCDHHNDRGAYALALQKHIQVLTWQIKKLKSISLIQSICFVAQVDIYGACGTMNCTNCYDIFERDYKFYLAFENSHCMDYISEKVYRNAMGHKVLPVGKLITHFLSIAFDLTAR